MEMTKTIYLEPWKSVLGRSILHYSYHLPNLFSFLYLIITVDMQHQQTPTIGQYYWFHAKHVSEMKTLKVDLLNFIRSAEFRERILIVCREKLIYLLVKKNSLIGKKTYNFSCWMLQSIMLLFGLLFSELCYPIDSSPLCF